MTFRVFEGFLEVCGSASLRFEKAVGNDLAAYTYGILCEVFFFIANLGIIFIPNMNSGLALMLRGISCMAIAIPVADAQKIPLHLTPHLFKIVTVRNIFVGVHIIMLFYCVEKLPISLVYIITQTTPIWVFILNYFQYKLPIHAKDVFIFILSLLGVTMITFPDFFYKFSEISDSESSSLDGAVVNSKYLQGNERLILVIAFLLSLSSYSFGLLFVKKAKEPLSVLQIIFNQGFIYMASGAVLQMSLKEVGSTIQISSISIILGLAFIGVLSYVYQIIFLRGTLITSNHGRYSMTGYSAVIFSYIYEIFLLGEIPNVVQIIGLAFVIASLFSL